MTDPRPGTPEFHREVLEYLCCESDEPMPLPEFFRRDVTGVSFSSSRREAIRWALDQISPAPDNVHPIGVEKLTMEALSARHILLAAADDTTIMHCVIVKAHSDGAPTVAGTTSDVAYSLMLMQEGSRRLLDMVDWEAVQPDPYPGAEVVPLAPKP